MSRVMRLADYLADNGIKQRFIADKAGVAIHVVQRIVAGVHEPKVSDALKIADVCKVEVTLADLIPPERIGVSE